MSPASAEDEPGFLLAASHETASYENQRYEGHYQGLVARIGWKNAWASAEAALPAYRIVRNGLADQGPGDLHLDARARVLRGDEATTRAGVVLDASLPTGDADADLGMGHPMIVPGLWGAARWLDLSSQLLLGYGRALEFEDDRGHRHGPSPIVHPMNKSELSGSFAGVLSVARHFDLRGGVRGAVPIATDDGVSRASAFFGFGLGRGPFRTSIDGHVPLYGDPFDLKLVLEIAARL